MWGSMLSTQPGWPLLGIYELPGETWNVSQRGQAKQPSEGRSIQPKIRERAWWGSVLSIQLGAKQGGQTTLQDAKKRGISGTRGKRSGDLGRQDHQGKAQGGRLGPFSTLAVIRLEPGDGRADGHPGRVAQVLCEASGCAAGILGGH